MVEPATNRCKELSSSAERAACARRQGSPRTGAHERIIAAYGAPRGAVHARRLGMLGRLRVRLGHGQGRLRHHGRHFGWFHVLLMIFVTIVKLITWILP
jgi:hypothetical protein